MEVDPRGGAGQRGEVAGKGRFRPAGSGRRVARSRAYYRWREVNEFLCSQTGRVMLAGLFLVTFVLLVFQFFKWDERRRLQGGLVRPAPIPVAGETRGGTGGVSPASWESPRR